MNEYPTLWERVFVAALTGSAVAAASLKEMSSVVLVAYAQAIADRAKRVCESERGAEVEGEL